MTVKAASATETTSTVLRAGWKDYLALTKPRVISLLLFTTLAAMYIAPGGTKQVSIILFLAVAVGGYMSAGSANAFNMVIDHDIDGLMVRTTGRPTVTHLISARAGEKLAASSETRPTDSDRRRNPRLEDSMKISPG